MVEYVNGIETRLGNDDYIAGAVVFPLTHEWPGPSTHGRWFFFPMIPAFPHKKGFTQFAVDTMMKTASPNSKVFIASFPWAGMWSANVYAFKKSMKEIGKVDRHADVDITLNFYDANALLGIRDALPGNVKTIQVTAPDCMREMVCRTFGHIDTVWFNDFLVH